MRTARGDVVDAVCRELEKAGDPGQAQGQQAYLKSVLVISDTVNIGTGLRHPG